MQIFAIDPGNVNSAFCVMDDQYRLLDFAKKPNEEVMQRMIYWLRDMHSIDSVIIERVASYGMAVGREVFETCEWIGRFTQEAHRDMKDGYIANYPGTPVFYIYRKDEKVTICGNMKAKDANIRQALIDRFAKFDFKSGKGTKKNPDYFYGVSADCWSAIAIGVTWLDMQKED